MLKKGLYTLCITSILSASSTMCFKKDHADLSTIETTALNGGKCNGKRSVVEMKKDGFIVDDIKITSSKNGFDYVYIFKKGVVSNQTLNTSNMTRSQMKAQLKEILNEDEVAKKVEETKIAKKLGKEVYTEVCVKCHGINGEISAYNVVRPLNILSVEDIKESFRDYGLEEKDNGYAILMKPYVDKYSADEVHSIATYIQTLK